MFLTLITSKDILQGGLADIREYLCVMQNSVFQF